jgi:hypothetical protein
LVSEPFPGASQPHPWRRPQPARNTRMIIRPGTHSLGSLLVCTSQRMQKGCLDAGSSLKSPFLPVRQPLEPFPGPCQPLLVAFLCRLQVLMHKGRALLQAVCSLCITVLQGRSRPQGEEWVTGLQRPIHVPCHHVQSPRCPLRPGATAVLPSQTNIFVPTHNGVCEGVDGEAPISLDGKEERPEFHNENQEARLFKVFGLSADGQR